MRIAIPVSNGKLSVHFGHCRQFAIIDADPDSGRILRTVQADAPQHEPGLLPRWLAEKGVQVVITGGMGRRAQQLFAEGDVEVVVGAPAEGPERIALDYLEGKLATGENICDH